MERDAAAPQPPGMQVDGRDRLVGREGDGHQHARECAVGQAETPQHDTGREQRLATYRLSDGYAQGLRIILDANQNFLNTMGYTRDEVVGQHHRLFVEEQEARGAAYRNFWQTLARGEYEAGEYKRLAKGGREIGRASCRERVFSSV